MNQTQVCFHELLVACGQGAQAFNLIGAGDHLNPRAHEQAVDYRAQQALRVAEQSMRITGYLGSEIRRSTRGTPRRVVCLSRTSVDGLPMLFESVSMAGALVRQLAHHVSRSIKRGGTCGGERFCYLDDPSPELSKGVLVQLRTKAAAYLPSAA